MNVMTKEDRAVREGLRRTERDRRLRMVIMGILIPTFLSLIYYAFIAREQYVAQVRFTIQGLESQQADVLSTLGLPSQSKQSSDGYIVVDFIHSPEIVRALRRSYGFDQAYSAFTFDPAGYIPPNSPIEDASTYWGSQSSAAYDATSNVITVTVEAFTAQDALRLSQGVLAETDRLVNALNSKVRNEATKVAEREVAEKRADYDKAKQRVTALRASSALTLDATTQQQVSMLNGYETQIAQARVDKAAAQATFLPGSPQMRAIDVRISTLEAQREQTRAQVLGGPGSSEANRDISSQTALLDYEFAQKNYYAAVQALQTTISTRDNQRRYIVAYQPPRLPEKSNYWDRFSNVIGVAFAAAVAMGVAMLGYSIVKDHLQ